LALDDRGAVASLEQVVTLDESFAGLRLSFDARLGAVGGVERQADGGLFRVDLTVDGALAASYSDTMDSARSIRDSTQLSTPMDSVTLTAASASGAAGAELVVKFSYDTRGETSLYNSRVYLDNVRLERCAAPTAPPPQAQDGAIIEMTGDDPKLIFGTLENPTCQLSIDRPNGRLVSTCSIQDSRRRLEEAFDCEAKHAALEQKYEALRTEVSELRALVEQLKAAKMN